MRTDFLPQGWQARKLGIGSNASARGTTAGNPSWNKCQIVWLFRGIWLVRGANAPAFCGTGKPNAPAGNLLPGLYAVKAGCKVVEDAGVSL